MLANSLDDLAKKLCVNRDALNSADVLVLPENWENAPSDQALDTDDSIFLAKHLKHEGVNCKTAFDLGVRPRVKERRGADVWLGTIWVVSNIVIPTICGILSNYIFSKWARSAENGTASTLGNKPVVVHVDIRLFRDEVPTEIRFSGPAEDLARMLTAFKSGKEIGENGDGAPN